MRKMIIAAILAVPLLAGGVAYASIPSPSGVINGCYDNKSGVLTVIDSDASCPSKTTAINWNQVGPQGLTGATGATGATGPQGPAGSANLHVILSTITQDQWGDVPGHGFTVLLTCATGDVLLNAFVTSNSSSYIQINPTTEVLDGSGQVTGVGLYSGVGAGGQGTTTTELVCVTP